MENKEIVMDNYLFNLKFTVSRKCYGLKMLCHVALICTIYYMHCGMPGDLSGEVYWFVPLYLFLIYLNKK